MSFLDSIKKLFAPKETTTLSVINIEKRFELMGRTGQGSMSKVWRARDKQSGKLVCLKVLDREKTAKFEARFQGLKKPTEGEICMLLKHQNIVQTYEIAISTDKEPLIIMELIEGVGLNFLIETKNKQLNGNRVNYLSQYSVGLEFMHKSGYLHRDICPRNVMVNKDGVVKIIDLGLTVPFKPEFCRPGNRTGTTNYLAPELINRKATDQRVDMFALGVTAFEVFTGDFPWEKGTSQEVLRAIVNVTPREPTELRPELDKKTVAFLKKAIERDPRARFQSCAEFREAIEQLPKQ